MPNTNLKSKMLRCRDSRIYMYIVQVLSSVGYIRPEKCFVFCFLQEIEPKIVAIPCSLLDQLIPLLCAQTPDCCVGDGEGSDLNSFHNERIYFLMDIL